MQDKSLKNFIDIDSLEKLNSHIIFSEEVEPIIENDEDTIPEVQSIEVEDWETMFDEEVSQEALPHKVVEPKNNI